MAVQFGVIKPLVGGLNAQIHGLVWKKPRIILLYISKFDLFSPYHPNDSNSEKITEQVELLFSDHIAFIESEAKKMGVPFKLVVGSSTKKWHTKELIEHIVHELYKG